MPTNEQSRSSTGVPWAPDPEGACQAKHRRSSADHTRRILEEAEPCTQPGEIGVTVGASSVQEGSERERADAQRFDWLLLAQWTLATTLGLALGGIAVALIWQLVALQIHILAGIPGLLLGGVGMALTQRWVLRKRLDPARRWLSVTAGAVLGGIAVFVVLYLVPMFGFLIIGMSFPLPSFALLLFAFLSNETVIVAILGAAIGTYTGISQRKLLQRAVPGARTWVYGSISGWVLTTLTAGAIFRYGRAQLGALVLGLAAAGAVLGTVSGVALNKVLLQVPGRRLVAPLVAVPVACALIILLVAILSSPPVTPWPAETVAYNIGDHGGEHALVLDAAGRPHIAFKPTHPYDGLYYAWRDSDGWHREMVADGNVGYDVSLALDAAGRPHLSFTNGSTGDVLYAYRDDSGWHSETVDDDVAMGGGYPSLALDAAGRPHIAYADGTKDFGLVYAWNDGSRWQVESVDPSRQVGRWASLALDPSGRPHISYCDDQNHTLRYAWYDGSNWQVQTVDDSGFGYYTTLLLDAAGRPHITYYAGRQVKYTYYDGQAWQFTSSTGSAIAMALDDSGRPHLAYANVGTVRYATWDGSTWRDEAVTKLPETQGGIDLSLVLDEAGTPTICYTNHADDRIECASRHRH